ncbi:endospore germination permease [Ectobacillus funiculus]|uniref:GerAB/ArcD/ProY family transporter n=1 Tax=Ectobacillus funiculus TaxID=137993 RepID=UPI0039791124
MQKQQIINSWQMATLFLSFLTGSAIVNIPSPLGQAAGSGAWLSLCLANGLGMLLLACILYLHRQFPELTLIEYSRKILGKWLTGFISIPMLILILVDLSYLTIDIGDFFANTMMRETPPYVFHGLILLLVALTTYAGIQVMARMFTLLLYALAGPIAIVILLALPNYRPEYLLHTFSHGIKPILHGSYIAFGFPYAETLLFAMLLPFTHRESKHQLGKFMFASLFMSGISLVIAIVCSTMAFGPLTGELKYSLYQLVRLINIADIIERIESIIGLVLIAGSYMKATILLFILRMTLTKFLNLQDGRFFTFPLAFLALLLSLTMHKNEFEFATAVLVIWPLFITIVLVLPMILITICAFFKRKTG